MTQLSLEARDRLSRHYFGIPADRIGIAEKMLLDVIIDVESQPLIDTPSAADMIRCHTRGAYGMSERETADYYRRILRDVRKQKLELVERFSEELKKLVVVEKYSAEKAGEAPFGEDASDEREFFLAQLELHDASDPEAAMWALNKLGEASSATVIAGILHKYGFGTERDKKTLGNSLFNAMKRRPEFRKCDDGSWALKKWGQINMEKSNAQEGM